MKTIKLLAIIAFILISSVCYSIEYKEVVTEKTNDIVYLKCAGGYLFAIAKSRSWDSISIAQVFEGGIIKGTMLPVKCKDKK